MLRVEAVQAGYGAVKVLKGIRLHVPEGKIVALIGANGAGKTTTLRVIAGQLRPWSGRVTFAGRDISQRPAYVRPREGLVHVPEGRAVLARMTVEENLEMGAYVRRGPDVKQDLERVFARFPRLLERRRQLAGTLSGGEQQMLALGRALMARPRLLLLDEPSMGLAPLVTVRFSSSSRKSTGTGPLSSSWSKTPAKPCASPTTPTSWKPARSSWKAPPPSSSTIAGSSTRTWAARPARPGIEGGGSLLPWGGLAPAGGLAAIRGPVAIMTAAGPGAGDPGRPAVRRPSG